MPKTLVIVNPAAGGGRGKRMWPSLEPKMEAALGPLVVKFSRAGGDAAQIARKESKYKKVIVCGGDGTLHEVANGLFKQGKTAKERPLLGILSLGTGGDFIKSLKIPKNLTEQIEILRRGNQKTIDVGEIEFQNKGNRSRRIFLNIVDAGFGADVLKQLHGSRSLFGRDLAYLFATLRAYVSRKCHEIEIIIDGERGWKEKPLIVALANGQYFGGGMHFAPKADLSDGLIDITLLKDFSPTWLPAVLPSLYSKIERLPQVTMRKGRKIEILSDYPVPLDIDGEQIGTLPLVVRVVPRALRVIVP